MFSGKLDGLETAEPRQEMGCGDAPDRLSRILVRWVLTPLAGLWCGFLLVTWLPTYLTWPWYTDSEHFAMLARLWDSGGLPYRDMFSTQFPGEIYLHWLLGKLLGWGNTVAYYAVDAALVIAFGALLVLWGRRRVGSALPGWIGFSTFLLYYVSQNYTVAGQRDWHAAFLVLFCLLLPGIGSAPAFRVGSVQIGVAAPSLRKPTVACWAQCRPPGSDPSSLGTIRRTVGGHGAHCDMGALILRTLSGPPTDSVPRAGAAFPG